MFRFTQTIIRELQTEFSQSYNIDYNIQVVVEIFSIMAAYFVQPCCACVLCTVQNTQCIIVFNIVTLAKRRL